MATSKMDKDALSATVVVSPAKLVQPNAPNAKAKPTYSNTPV